MAKLDLQSIGSSPVLHILCARNTIMILFMTWGTWPLAFRICAAERISNKMLNYIPCSLARQRSAEFGD